MRKFLLVVFIGMVLAINLYGFVGEIISYLEVEEPDANNGSTTVVYVE